MKECEPLNLSRLMKLACSSAITNAGMTFPGICTSVLERHA